jgi:hypothetical protein
MKLIGGQMRAVATPHGHVPHTNCTMIRDITQGKTIHHCCKDHKNNIIVTYNELTQHTAGPLIQLSGVELPKTWRNVNLHTPECIIIYISYYSL